MEGNRDRVESASVRHGREVAAWTAVSQGGRGGEKSYTARDWLASILVRQQNASVLDTLSYYYTDASNVYDPTGHLRREVDAGNRTHAFFYDNLYELVQETHPDFGTLSYSYDLNGNRATRTSGLGTDYYGVDANNKLLWVNQGSNTPPTHNQANAYTLFTYDACGRTTYREKQYPAGWHRDFSLAWDGDDHLRSVKNGTDTWLSASYDGDGTRVSKSDFWTGAHNYSWGPGGVVYDSSGSGTVYTPGFAQRQGSTDRFAHDDWLGSTRYLSDYTGNAFPSALRFDAFGNRSATGGTDAFDSTEFQFAGAAGYETEYASATEPGVGLQLLGQRYYDPVVGRFISQDPIGLSDYGYAGNDPVGLIDPSGLTPLYDQWHDYLYGGLRGGQQEVNNALASNWLGVAAATAINTYAEFGIGVLDLPAGLAHLPEAWRHWGEGTGRFAAEPSLENVPGPLEDLILPVSTALLLEGGVRGAGKFVEAVRARGVGERGVSGCKGGQAGSGTDDTPASSPVGRRGRLLRVRPGGNSPSTINGREYSGHALDRMQERGLTPTVIEDTIGRGTPSPGSRAGTTKYTTEQAAVVISETGRVVTVFPQ